MKSKHPAAFRWIAVLSLIVLFCGCTADTSSADAILQNTFAFLADFARQILTAFLL